MKMTLKEMRKALTKSAEGRTILQGMSRLAPDTGKEPKGLSRLLQEETQRQQPPRWRSNMWKIVGVVVPLVFSVVFGGPLLWEGLSANPALVPPPTVDARNPFKDDFSVVNDMNFYTLYNVHTSCHIEDYAAGMIQEGMFSRDADVGNVRPKDKARFSCSMMKAPAVVGTKMRFHVTYEIHPFPYVSWPGEWDVSYELTFAGGNLAWSEGQSLEKKKPS